VASRIRKGTQLNLGFVDYHAMFVLILGCNV